LLVTIIAVLLLGLIGGGMVLVPQIFLAAGAQLTPGVIAREGLGNAQGGVGAGGTNGPGAPDAKTFCGPGSSPSSGAHSTRSSLAERLIGGGFDYRSGSDPSVAAPDNSTSQSAGQHAANWDWRLQLTDGKATSYAICLREAPTFFSPASVLDYIVGPVAKHFGLEEPEIASEASCPSSSNSSKSYISSTSSIAPTAGDILGGGYVLGGSHPPQVTSSYPIVDGSGARWHVSADPLGGNGSTVQAFAICSSTMTTHLEQTAMTMKSTDLVTFFGDGATSCTSGTLLSGGFHVMDGKRDIGLGVDIQTNSPGKSLKVNKTTGDTFTDWAVTLNGTTEGDTAKSVTGDIWVVCWDAATSLTPAAAIDQSTATPVGQRTATTNPQANPTPVPTNTPRPQSTPTNTPASQCQTVAQGSANNANIDLSDINLDGAGPATQPSASSHIRYNQTPVGTIFSPVNSSTLYRVGLGADFNALDCAHLRGFGYSGSSTVPYTAGEVFAVKTPGGHYAKVEITATAGGPMQVQWITYSVS
jgi:hypothetical protein